MITDRKEVEAFLREARELMAENRMFLVPRDVNLQGLADLNLTEAEAWSEISRLTVNNYAQGPEDDKDGSGTFVWVWGCTVEKKATYIKLKIEEGRLGKRLKCLSFHPATRALRFPLRP